eukprot:m.42006 g.42006  ORF g.42006 m.42006 type:complete len:83 (-) comp10480_c0_seq1:3164-3412(-)
MTTLLDVRMWEDSLEDGQFSVLDVRGSKMGGSSNNNRKKKRTNKLMRKLQQHNIKSKPTVSPSKPGTIQNQHQQQQQQSNVH